MGPTQPPLCNPLALKQMDCDIGTFSGVPPSSMFPTRMSPSECSTSTSKLKRTLESSSPLCLPWSLYPFDFPISAYISPVSYSPSLKTLGLSVVLPFPNPFHLIGYPVLPILPPQSPFRSFPLPLHGPGSHLLRPVAQCLCGQAVGTVSCFSHGHSSLPPSLPADVLTMIETENPGAYFPRLLCSQAWPCDLVWPIRYLGRSSGSLL